MKHSFTDEQLLNLVNNTIKTKTEFEVDEFTGGSVQITSTNNNQVVKYKVSLFFGYKQKNPISRTIDINENLVSIWINALHLKVKSIQVTNNGMDYSELNALMNNLPNEVDSNKVDSNKVESISRGITTSLTTPPTTTLNTDKLPYDEIISHLNQVCNTDFRDSSHKTKSLIQARLKEGFTLEDFQKVHITKYAEWNGTDMQKYLRPETLYGTKFESYLNQKLTNNEKYRAISEHTGMSALEMLKREGRA